jgi:DNA-binding NarL/FixJ family response regulator
LSTEPRPMINHELPPTLPSSEVRKTVQISVVFAGLWSVEVAGLEQIIDKITKTAPRFIVGDERKSIRGLGRLVHREGAHLLIMDDDLIPYSPEHSIPYVLRNRPTLKIVVLHSNPLNGKVDAYLRAGVHAVLHRNTNEVDMPSLLFKVLQGHRFPEAEELAEKIHPACETVSDPHELEDVGVDLLPRERMVLAGLIAGKRNKEIATDMKTSEQVIKNTFKRVYRKFGVKGRAELASVILGYGAES